MLCGYISPPPEAQYFGVIYCDGFASLLEMSVEERARNWVCANVGNMLQQQRTEEDDRTNSCREMQASSGSYCGASTHRNFPESKRQLCVVTLPPYHIELECCAQPNQEPSGSFNFRGKMELGSEKKKANVSVEHMIATVGAQQSLRSQHHARRPDDKRWSKRMFAVLVCNPWEPKMSIIGCGYN